MVRAADADFETRRRLIELLDVQGTLADPALDHDVCVFLTTVWRGDPEESEEMKPCWVAVDRIPFNQMWQDDILWLPRILAGDRVRGHFTFQNDGETLAAWKVEAWDGWRWRGERGAGTSRPTRPPKTQTR